ncbi:hypothetical protein ACFY94_32255 [Streptomyces griseorubiginosus]|uniref:hypothetical protein n=1 Tax=Streptomyces griseorubiginosus TaxID=67304 RepID=UPI0036F00573
MAANLVVRHFFLKAAAEVLEPRSDGRVRAWCKERIEACTAAVDTLPGDTVFLDGEAPPGELAGQVLAHLG